MGQFLVRDLDDEVIKRIELSATARGRSAEAEDRPVLEAAVHVSNGQPAKQARQLRHDIKAGGPDSADIIRRFRDQ